jgi:hypothetical protein
MIVLFGDGRETTALITGGVPVGTFDTATLTEELAVKFPCVSRATAARKCVPSADVVVFQETEYGELVSSAPIFAPSNWNWTPAIPALLDADAVTLIVPETIAPAAGDAIETVVEGGGGVVPARGKIPHMGVSPKPLFRIAVQFVAPVSLDHDAEAPAVP